MSKRLEGKRVAILVADGFEQSELSSPKTALEDAGADVDIVSPETESVQSMVGKEWDERFTVDVSLDDAKLEDYDALLLPGGVINPDRLRTNERAVAFVRGFFMSKKPVGAICHGPWMLAEADVVQGRDVTSWKSIRTDLVNARGVWSDAPVVVDAGLVTSRCPDDLPKFNEAVIEAFAAGVHEDQRAVA